MADLIAITFDTQEEAQRARQQFARMSRDYVVELVDSVIAYKDDKERVKLDQTINLTTAGAVNGSFLGILVGVILTVPTGGLVLPVVSALFGAGVGALSGKLSDYGIDDDMMRELAGGVAAGKATLFVLASKVGSERFLAELDGFHNKVIKTSLSSELEEEIARALSSN